MKGGCVFYNVSYDRTALAYLTRVEKWAGHMVTSTKVEPEALDSEYHEVTVALRQVELNLRKCGLID